MQRLSLLFRFFMPILLVLAVLMSISNLWLAQSHFLHVSDFWINLIGKMACYALCALALDLIWGYCGVLSLGHGLFFAIGGYIMGMHLMRQIGRDGVYQSDLPDFMVFLDWKELPWHWSLSRSEEHTSELQSH